MLGLEDVRGFDALPSRGDLYENTLFANTNGFVELQSLSARFIGL